MSLPKKRQRKKGRNLTHTAWEWHHEMLDNARRSKSRWNGPWAGCEAVRLSLSCSSSSSSSSSSPARGTKREGNLPRESNWLWAETCVLAPVWCDVDVPSVDPVSSDSRQTRCTPQCKSLLKNCCFYSCSLCAVLLARPVGAISRRVAA